MAIQLEKENSKFNIYEQHFLIDSKNDLQTLESEYDCNQGDKAELPDGSYYLRHSDDYQGEKWELVKSSSGGNSGGLNLPAVTSEDNGSILEVKNGEWNKGEAHYIVTEGTEPILSESTIEPLDYTEEPVASIGTALVSKKPKKGDKCMVVLNGETFYKVADEVTIQGQTITIIGDNIYYGEELETFFIAFSSAENIMEMLWPGSDSITLKIDVISKNISITEDFTTAVKLATEETEKNWIINKRIVTYTQEEASTNHNTIISLTNNEITTLESTGELLVNSIAIVNGIELPFDASEHAWITTVDEIEYFLSPNSSNPLTLSFDCTDGTESIPGDYNIGIYLPKEELPIVTSNDNGKVLTVVNGEWDKVTPQAPPLVVWQQYTMFRNTTTGYAGDAIEFLDENANSVNIDTIISQINAGMFVRILGHNDGYIYYMSGYNELKFSAIADPTHWVTFSVQMES